MVDASSLLSFMVQLAVSSVGFLLTVMLSTILSGELIEIGKGYGKVFTSPRFQRKQTLFWAFLIEAVALSLLFAFVEPYIDKFLWMFKTWLPIIFIEAFVLYYIWFCVKFEFNIYGKAVGYPQIAVILNVAIVKLLEWLGVF